MTVHGAERKVPERAGPPPSDDGRRGERLATLVNDLSGQILDQAPEAWANSEWAPVAGTGIRPAIATLMFSFGIVEITGSYVPADRPEDASRKEQVAIRILGYLRMNDTGDW